MKTQNRLVGLTMIMTLAFVVGEARAQAPAAAPPGKIYTKSKLFCLPVALDDKERATLQEVQLYVKNGPNEPWVMKDSAPPSRNEFDYRVSEDGEYSFAIAIIEKSGKSTPVDTNRMTPGIIVVVDTQPPELFLRTLPAGAQGTLVECKVQDANPDPSRLRVEYQAVDKTWKPLEPTPGDPTIFQVPGPLTPDSIVRATTADRAGNKSTRVLNLAAAAGPAPGLGDALTLVSMHESRSDKVSVAPPDPTGTAPARQLVAGTHVTMDYRIENKGPTGISKIEVWVTRDESLTWQRLCEDSSNRNPVEFDLPGEGVFGISLVATNGIGLGGEPPVKGDVPDCWVEVDMTKPVAQLLAVRPGTGEDEGTLLINWVANDKNMGATPIDLYYATQREGPWLPVSKGMRNDGSYRWTLPRDTPSHEFFIRMDVTDRAGNVARCETPQVVVVDLVRPKARVLSVKASNSRPTPPVEN